MFAWAPYFLYVTGIFAVALGAVHFVFPLLFDFRGAIPEQGDALKPFPLILTSYATTRQDIRGLIWVMNYAASFAILSLGLLDLAWTIWLPARYGVLIALWIALFWFVRAGAQLYMGRRRGDWLVLCGFALVGGLHVLAAMSQ